jgi:hypothetical protein
MSNITDRIILAYNVYTNQTCILYYTGPTVVELIRKRMWIDYNDLGLDMPPGGISIWEGTYIEEHGILEPGDSDIIPHGNYRPLNTYEWICIENNASPFKNLIYD